MFLRFVKEFYPVHFIYLKLFTFKSHVFFREWLEKFRVKAYSSTCDTIIQECFSWLTLERLVCVR